MPEALDKAIDNMVFIDQLIHKGKVLGYKIADSESELEKIQDIIQAKLKKLEEADIKVKDMLKQLEY